MMKQLLLITTTAILITAAFWVGVRSRSAGPATPSESFERQERPAPLTDVEERELRWRITSTLKWILTWQNKIWNCPSDKGVETLDLLSIYQQHAGQGVEMSVARSEDNIAVSFDVLHINMGFRRLHERRLGPASVGYICEKSLAEHVAAVRARAAGSRAEGEQAMAAARSDPHVGLILSEMDKKQPNVEVKEKEMRRYALPSLSDLLKQSSPSTAQKESLYQAILTVIKGDVESIECGRGKSIMVTVPVFDVGDPEMYVLLEAPDPYGTFIKHISFDRSPESGDYEAYAQKDISLPQQVNSLRRLVTQRAFQRLNFNCRGK